MVQHDIIKLPPKPYGAHLITNEVMQKITLRVPDYYIYLFSIPLRHLP